MSQKDCVRIKVHPLALDCVATNVPVQSRTKDNLVLACVKGLRRALAKFLLHDGVAVRLIEMG